MTTTPKNTNDGKWSTGRRVLVNGLAVALLIAVFAVLYWVIQGRSATPANPEKGSDPVAQGSPVATEAGNVPATAAQAAPSIAVAVPVTPLGMAAPTMPVDANGLPSVYVSDLGDGRYRNPIILADYSDPDAIRVGDDYFMTGSSISQFPGLPILHSKDLVNWTIVGHAAERHPLAGFDRPNHGNGIWAPAIQYHDGEFFIYFGDPQNGIFMTKAKNPAGPWSPLSNMQGASGAVDTCPFWDTDGKAYLVHTHVFNRNPTAMLDLFKMSPDGMQLLDSGTNIVNGEPLGLRYVLGPKMYKRNGYYYIFADSLPGANAYQIAFRSKEIGGPYEHKIVMDKGTTQVNGPHHGAWVTTQTGEDWFIHYEDRGAYGRVTHLEPMQWINDWPMIGEDPDGDGKGQPVLVHAKPIVGKTYPVAAPQTSDEFDKGVLGMQWQWPANYEKEWASLTARAGYLRLPAVALARAIPLYDRANPILQKLPAEQFKVTAMLDVSGLGAGESAGLVVTGGRTASIQVRKEGAGLKIVRTNGTATADTEGAAGTVDGSEVYVRVQVMKGASCTFSYSKDGKEFTALGPAFVAGKESFIGAKVGLFCNTEAGGAASGYADVDWIRFEPVEAVPAGNR